MITISLCMIVKNEEDTLGNCLKSIADIVDEIIIVDTGSTDRTKEIASCFTPQIYDFKWIDDFSAARNYSFSKATKEYILWLDADDELLEEDRRKLISLKETLEPDIDVAMMKYNYSFDSVGNITLSHFRERLVKRSKGFIWVDPIHEWIDISGNIIKSDICITHKKQHTSSGRNLKILRKMIEEGREFSARNLFYYACELMLNGFYEDAIIYLNKYLDMGMGTENERLYIAINLVNCYKYKNDKDGLLKTLLKFFQYDISRAEVCCNIGYYYKYNGDYVKAAYWFGRALTLIKPDDERMAIHHDYWGYIPCIELSYCYYMLGNIDAAIEFKNRAAEYKPDNLHLIRKIIGKYP